MCRQQGRSSAVTGKMRRQIDFAQFERLVDDGAAAVGFDDDDAARQPVVVGPADRQGVDAALRQFGQRPVAVGVLADRRRQFDIEREAGPDAGRRDRDVGGRTAQGFFDMLGRDPVVAVGQYADAADVIDADVADGDQARQVEVAGGAACGRPGGQETRHGAGPVV